jgi:hypothetical protein
MNGTCGQINGSVKYNSSGTGPETDISNTTGAVPFYTFDPNPRSCGQMSENDNCTLTWTVNSTGNLGDFYNIGVWFGNATGGNQTQNQTIEIGKVLLMSLIFDAVEFGILDPGEENQSAINNSDHFYNISVNKNSNNLDYLWIKAGDLAGDSWPGYKIIPGNISWSFINSHNTGTVIGYHYSLMDTSVPSGQNKTTYYWIDIPYGLMAQNYIGQMTIKANASW